MRPWHGHLTLMKLLVRPEKWLDSYTNSSTPGLLHQLCYNYLHCLWDHPWICISSLKPKNSKSLYSRLLRFRVYTTIICRWLSCLISRYTGNNKICAFLTNLLYFAFPNNPLVNTRNDIIILWPPAHCNSFHYSFFPHTISLTSSV